MSEPPMAWVIVNCRGEPVRSQLPTYTDPAIHADPSRMLCICDANHEDGFPHRWLSLYAHPPVESTASATLTPDERAELERLRSAPYYWAQNNGAILEDSDRYRWFRDNCELDRQEEIIEAAEGVADLLDHHIDKGRCGL